MPYVGLYPDFAIFSVSRPVGFDSTAVNHPDDVRLVQWLLTQSSNRFYPFAGPPLQIDGYYGPATDYHLCRFCLALIRKLGWGAPVDVGPWGFINSDGSGVQDFLLGSGGAFMRQLNTPIDVELRRDWRSLLTRMPILLRKALEADIRKLYRVIPPGGI